MILDTTIIDEYIRSKSTEEIKKHWIFDNIVEGKHLFADPPKEHFEKIIVNRSLISKRLKKFEPSNIEVWSDVFENRRGSTNEQIAMLIVGSPAPYDAFVRKDKSGNNVMVFDVERMVNYPNPAEVINGIITHEVAHTLIQEDFHMYCSHFSFEDNLKQMLFDEGFAHYVSFPRLIELNSNEYLQRKQQVYTKLKEVIAGTINKQHFIEGNSGTFWDKYISISGMFTIVDYIAEGGDLKELYNKGYEYFFEQWQRFASAY